MLKFFLNWTWRKEKHDKTTKKNIEYFFNKYNIVDNYIYILRCIW